MLDGVRLFSRFVGVLGLGARLCMCECSFSADAGSCLSVNSVLSFLVVVVVVVAVLVPSLYNIVTTVMLLLLSL